MLFALPPRPNPAASSASARFAIFAVKDLSLCGGNDLAAIQTLHLREDLLAARELPIRSLLNRDDLRGAVGVLLLVFLTTFPLVIPFFFIHEPWRALRVSNLVAVVMLFVAGHRLGKYAMYHPVRLGLLMVAIGIVLVAMTIALGG